MRKRDGKKEDQRQKGKAGTHDARLGLQTFCCLGAMTANAHQFKDNILADNVTVRQQWGCHNGAHSKALDKGAQLCREYIRRRSFCLFASC